MGLYGKVWVTDNRKPARPPNSERRRSACADQLTGVGADVAKAVRQAAFEIVRIAGPEYLKYLSKSRQTEAKFALSTVFIGMKSYAVEYTTYTNCLQQAGFSTNVKKRYYSVGIPSLVANMVLPDPGGPIITRL